VSFSIFKESNRVRWSGIRPGVYGEQTLIFADDIVATALVYTVPVGKVLLLFNDYFSVRSVAAASTARVYVRDETTAVRGLIAAGSVHAGASEFVTSTHARFVPLELIGGWDIRIVYTLGNAEVWFSAEGLLIDPAENT